MMSKKLVVQENGPLERTGRRLRARRVNEYKSIEYVRGAAKNANEVVIEVAHGGSVCNSYKYPAETEVLVTVGFPNGHVYQAGDRLPANKVTYSGVLATCLGDWARPFCDPRFHVDNRAHARKLIIEHAVERFHEADPDFAMPPEI